ncbi:MAG: TolC family protein [Bdellovibrionaceae bacterium]|nr:TolC family protein [Pseudobdellovibrionaceae bacterium]
MVNYFFKKIVSYFVLLAFVVSCAPTLPLMKKHDANKAVPNAYPDFDKQDKIAWSSQENVPLTNKTSIEGTTKESSAKKQWKDFFVDGQLRGLIDQALDSNQELNIFTQEVNIAEYEIMARKGEYLPKMGFSGKAGLEKVGKYTSQGVSDATSEYEPGKVVPEKLPLYQLGLVATWEVDIWKKLRNATKAAFFKYLSSVDGRNFIITRLVAEISSTYYELMALDKQLEIVNNNIEILKEGLKLVRIQQQAARVTSLAVKRFEAEVLKNQSRQYDLQQRVIITENRLNVLVGRYPQPIARHSTDFIDLVPYQIHTGVPAQLLDNRTDVKRAELALKAAELDVKVAKARFYPSLSIDAGLGYQSFNSKHLFASPDSVFYGVAANLTAPLLNRMAIKADYFSANSKQIQAVYDYEKTLITAYTDVVNQLAKIKNLEKIYELKSRQVAALKDSIDISTILFKAARVDYVEALLTRRDALESQIELVEVKKDQMIALVNLYQALGGGWYDPQELKQ